MPAAESACVQVSLGFLLPVSLELAAAAQRMHQHQQERAAAGLQPERGLHAAVLGALWACCSELSGLALGALCCVALALAWDWTALFVVPPEQRVWAKA